VLRDRILIAEPWDVGENGYQLGAFPYPFIEWNDRFRDEVRRFWRGDANMLGAFATRLAGSADIFQRNGRAPSASLNFIAAHDGFALRDLVARAAKENHANGEQNRDGSNSEICWIANDARAAARALLASLFLSLGVPMLTAGDEFGRTQGGNNNAYAQDNEITWLDWGRADDDLAAFVGALSKARAQIPALNRDAFLDGFADAAGRRAVAWLTPEGAPMRDEDWREADALSVLFESETTAFWIALNRGRQARSFTPPQIGAARWRIVVSSNVSTPSDLAQSDHLDAPQCAVILLESRA
jgi:glycogen operon protein